MGVSAMPRRKILVALFFSLLIHGVVAFYANVNTFSVDARRVNQYPQFASLSVRVMPPKNIISVETAAKAVTPKPIKPKPIKSPSRPAKPIVKKQPLKKTVVNKILPVKKSKPTPREAPSATAMVDENSHTNAKQPEPANNPVVTLNTEKFDAFDTNEVTETPPQIAEYFNNPKPIYPLAAKRRGMQGQVLLEVTVNTLGIASKVIVKQSSGFKILDNAAVKAVASWKFVPAMSNSIPMESIVEVPIRFELAQG